MRNNLGQKLLKINMIVLWLACTLNIINIIFINSDLIRGIVFGINLLILIQCVFTTIYDFIDTQKTNKEIKRLDKEITSNMEEIKNKKLGR